MSDRSLAALLSFLDYLSEKGLMAAGTATGRKASCNKVLGILDPEEQTDVTVVNLDDAMHRFINLEGKNYTPSSLTVYKSRVASAISDFTSYLANPSGFKPSVAQKKTGNGSPKKVAGPKASSHNAAPIQKPDVQPIASANVYPIPIRADVVVRIHGLPFDLTPAEAEKIAAVVKAMAL
jgi:hypothetical protein